MIHSLVQSSRTIQFLKPRWAIPLILAAIGLALLIRWSLFGFVSRDYSFFLKSWYETIRAAGGLKALAYPFSNYTPPYLYLLVLISNINFLQPMIAIKLLSTVFDVLAALVVYRILKLQFSGGLAPAAGAAVFLLAPTVIINSALWAQCDVIYTGFLLGFMFFALQDRPWLAMLCFAVAFSFKLQAIFITPFILILILRHKIPWYSLLLVPAVYLVMVVPAWLQGRPLMDLLQIYIAQMGDNPSHLLSLNAPNPYIFFTENPPASATTIGIAIAFLVGLGLALASWKFSGTVTKERLVIEATLALTLMPFILPKMHERYFFPAAAFMLLLVWFRPGYWWAALLFQVTSYLSYLPFLFLGDRQTLPVMIGAVGNVVIVVALVVGYFRQPVPILIRRQ